MLNPDRTEKITFHLPVDSPAFHDMDLNLIIETGKINVMIDSCQAICGKFGVTGWETMKVKPLEFVCPVQVQ